MKFSKEFIDALYSALRFREVRLSYLELEDSLEEAAEAQLDTLDKLSRHWQKSTGEDLNPYRRNDG